MIFITIFKGNIKVIYDLTTKYIYNELLFIKHLYFALNYTLNIHYQLILKLKYLNKY